MLHIFTILNYIIYVYARKGLIRMKKLFILTVLMFGIVLIGCANNKNDQITILAPEGTPAFSQILMEYNATTDEDYPYTVERVAGPQILSSAFLHKSNDNNYDIIIAPVNLGANLISKGAEYKLAAVVTWGNLQLLSTQPIADLEAIKNKEIIAFGNGSIPQMILNSILSDFDDTYDFDVQYIASNVQESFMHLMRDPNVIVLTAEPITTRANDLIDELFVFDLADYWTEEMNLPLFPQAGVFVSNTLKASDIENYLFELQMHIDYINNNPASAALKTEALDYTFEIQLVEKSIPMSKIHFKTTDDAYETLSAFFELIYAFNPDLIGGHMPKESFYYRQP